MHLSTACIPCSVPVKELKLLALPTLSPENTCYTSVSHYLISFSFLYLYFFWNSNKCVFEAIAGTGRERVRENIYCYSPLLSSTFMISLALNGNAHTCNEKLSFRCKCSSLASLVPLLGCLAHSHLTGLRLATDLAKPYLSPSLRPQLARQLFPCHQRHRSQL